MPLLEGLGFEPSYNKQVLSVSEKLSFQLSHKGWDSSKAPVIHCVAPGQNLEEPTGKAQGTRSRSPHDELQAYLNVTKDCNWGIVTNGVMLRVLRQFYHITTKGYVEFDIENIFRDRSFSDFRLLYRIAHSSRFTVFEKGRCILENFYDESRVAGVRIGQDLRKNVKKAIESLGNGFLTPALSKEMMSNEVLIRSYYSELLRIVYRLIFLLFAEQRGMLPTRDSIYADEYSINKLTEIAESASGEDQHLDLWEGLKVTFKVLKNGSQDLKVFAYNGTLFDQTQIPMLSQLSCANSDLLFAVSQLTSIEQEHVRSRINYLDLGVEEIGSIYESLLEYVPRVANIEEEIEGETVPSGSFYLDPRGATRKSTGSYYTSARLIDELINSALKPVLGKKLSGTLDKEKAILSLKVCDPACGSGAFLIAANNYLAKELARIRTSQLEPMDQEVRRARRDVLQHCIYGVDVNPMAIELAKVSLWINGSVDDMPLNFLDHHLKCGNSLLGASRQLIEIGVPDEAFTPFTNESKEIARKIVKANRSSRGTLTLEELTETTRGPTATEFAALSEQIESEVGGVEEKKRKYQALVTHPSYVAQKNLADAWTAAFFWPLQTGAPEPPISGLVSSLARGNASALDARSMETVHKLAQDLKFFHWYLEFPEVFSQGTKGFDCVLGNPPWEKIKLEEREWFMGRDQHIADCESKVERARLIQRLRQERPALFRQWTESRLVSQKQANFTRASGRFKLTGVGDANTFPLFAEHCRGIIAETGRTGLVLKTGIAVDETWADFFGEVVRTKTLCSFYDFENSELIFPAVAPVERFCLLTIAGLGEPQKRSDFAFLLTSPEQLSDPDRRLNLSSDEVGLINPNSNTLPSFQNQKDAQIVIQLQKRWPILINDSTGSNPWQIEYARIIDLTTDAQLFQKNTRENLEAKGFELESSGIFSSGIQRFLPLWEAKFFNQLDHRFATFEGIDEHDRFKRRAGTCHLTPEQKNNPDREVTARYWVSEEDFRQLVARHSWGHQWVFAFRDVTRMTTDTRSTMGTIIPWMPTGNSSPVLFFRGPDAAKDAILFCGVFTSVVLDYVLRQKMGGTHLNAFILKQLPAPSPPDFSSINIVLDGKAVRADSFIIEKILKLVWTSHSLDTLGKELGLSNGPFGWNVEERRKMRAEVDALIAKIYGVSREELSHMLDSFRILKDKDTVEFGRFRTKEDTLTMYDHLELKREALFQ